MLHRRSFISQIDHELNLIFIYLIELSFVLFFISKILVNYWLFSTCNVLTYANLGISLVFIFLPNDKINDYIFGKKNVKVNKFYS